MFFKVVLSVSQRMDDGSEKQRLEATIGGLAARLAKRDYDMKLPGRTGLCWCY